jgi:hypothetical protein
MKNAILIGMWGISVCAAVALGVTIARPRPPESVPAIAQPAVEQQEQASRTPDLAAQLDELRGAIGEEDREIHGLRDELDALRRQLPTPLSPEMEKELKRRLEWRKRKDAEKPWSEKRTALRKKILQRKDKALREEGLTELLALLQGEDRDDQEMAFGILSGLRSVKCDKEKFKPYVLAALSCENPSLRHAAVRCVEAVCSHDEKIEIAVRMVKDPDLEIRSWAALELSWPWTDQKYKDAAMPALRSLLEEGSRSTKWTVLERLYGSAERVDDVVVKLMGTPGLEGALVTSLQRRRTITEAIVGRLAQMYEEGTSDEKILRFLDPGRIHLGDPNDPRKHQGHPCLAEDARPIVRDIYLGIVRDGLWKGRRRQALEGLRKMGDPWVIPELQEIANSPDAEGIEEELARTIEHLQKGANEVR